MFERADIICILDEEPVDDQRYDDEVLSVALKYGHKVFRDD